MNGAFIYSAVKQNLFNYANSTLIDNLSVGIGVGYVIGKLDDRINNLLSAKPNFLILMAAVFGNEILKSSIESIIFSNGESVKEKKLIDIFFENSKKLFFDSSSTAKMVLCIANVAYLGSKVGSPDHVQSIFMVKLFLNIIMNNLMILSFFILVIEGIKALSRFTLRRKHDGKYTKIVKLLGKFTSILRIKPAGSSIMHFHHVDLQKIGKSVVSIYNAYHLIQHEDFNPLSLYKHKRKGFFNRKKKRSQSLPITKKH